jgi:hypothetical protein
MTTTEKIKAVQDGEAMIDNDCSVEQLNKVLLKVFVTDRGAQGLCKFYTKHVDPFLKWVGVDVNPNNLPTIPASSFFDNDEPMINISVKRLEELAKDVSEYKHIYFQAGVKKLCDILKQEAK